MFFSGYVQVMDYIGGEYSETVYLGKEPLANILRGYNGKNVYICYAFWDRRITPGDLRNLAIMSAMGECEARLFGCYSEITGFLYLEQDGAVGGHNLLSIFEENVDKFGAIVIQETPIDLTMF